MNLFDIFVSNSWPSHAMSVLDLHQMLSEEYAEVSVEDFEEYMEAKDFLILDPSNHIKIHSEYPYLVQYYQDKIVYYLQQLSNTQSDARYYCDDLIKALDRDCFPKLSSRRKTDLRKEIECSPRLEVDYNAVTNSFYLTLNLSDTDSSNDNDTLVSDNNGGDIVIDVNDNFPSSENTALFSINSDSSPHIVNDKLEKEAKLPTLLNAIKDTERNDFSTIKKSDTITTDNDCSIMNNGVSQDTHPPKLQLSEITKLLIENNEFIPTQKSMFYSLLLPFFPSLTVATLDEFVNTKQLLIYDNDCVKLNSYYLHLANYYHQCFFHRLKKSSFPTIPLNTIKHLLNLQCYPSIMISKIDSMIQNIVKADVWLEFDPSKAAITLKIENIYTPKTKSLRDTTFTPIRSEELISLFVKHRWCIKSIKSEKILYELLLPFLPTISLTSINAYMYKQEFLIYDETHVIKFHSRCPWLKDFFRQRTYQMLLDHIHDKKQPYVFLCWLPSESSVCYPYLTTKEEQCAFWKEVFEQDSRFQVAQDTHTTFSVSLVTAPISTQQPKEKYKEVEDTISPLARNEPLVKQQQIDVNEIVKMYFIHHGFDSAFVELHDQDYLCRVLLSNRSEIQHYLTQNEFLVIVGEGKKNVKINAAYPHLISYFQEHIYFCLEKQQQQKKKCEQNYYCIDRLDPMFQLFHPVPLRKSGQKKQFVQKILSDNRFASSKETWKNIIFSSSYRFKQQRAVRCDVTAPTALITTKALIALFLEHRWCIRTIKYERTLHELLLPFFPAISLATINTYIKKKEFLIHNEDSMIKFHSQHPFLKDFFRQRTYQMLLDRTHDKNSKQPYVFLCNIPGESNMLFPALITREEQCEFWKEVYEQDSRFQFVQDTDHSTFSVSLTAAILLQQRKKIHKEVKNTISFARNEVLNRNERDTRRSDLLFNTRGEVSQTKVEDTDLESSPNLQLSEMTKLLVERNEFLPNLRSTFYSLLLPFCPSLTIETLDEFVNTKHLLIYDNDYVKLNSNNPDFTKYYRKYLFYRLSKSFVPTISLNEMITLLDTQCFPGINKINLMIRKMIHEDEGLEMNFNKDNITIGLVVKLKKENRNYDLNEENSNANLNASNSHLLSSAAALATNSYCSPPLVQQQHQKDVNEMVKMYFIHHGVFDSAFVELHDQDYLRRVLLLNLSEIQHYLSQKQFLIIGEGKKNVKINSTFPHLISYFQQRIRFYLEKQQQKQKNKSEQNYYCIDWLDPMFELFHPVPLRKKSQKKQFVQKILSDNRFVSSKENWRNIIFSSSYRLNNNNNIEQQDQQVCKPGRIQLKTVELTPAAVPERSLAPPLMTNHHIIDTSRSVSNVEEMIKLFFIRYGFGTAFEDNKDCMEFDHMFSALIQHFPSLIRSQLEDYVLESRFLSISKISNERSIVLHINAYFLELASYFQDHIYHQIKISADQTYSSDSFNSLFNLFRPFINTAQRDEFLKNKVLTDKRLMMIDETISRTGLLKVTVGLSESISSLPVDDESSNNNLEKNNKEINKKSIDDERKGILERNILDNWEDEDDEEFTILSFPQKVLEEIY